MSELFKFPIVGTLISILAIFGIGTFVNSVIPGRYWNRIEHRIGHPIPGWLRLFSAGFIIWIISLLLSYYQSFLHEIAEGFIKGLEVEAAVGGRFNAYALVATILAFLIGFLMFVVANFWKDRRQKHTEKRRQDLMEALQKKIIKEISEHKEA